MLISALIKRPIGVCAFTIAMALLGVMAVRQLPVSLLPPVDLPVLTVRVDYEKIPASQLEERILQPLEEVLGTLPGLARLEGRAVTGAVEVRLQLHADVVIDSLVNHLNELLSNVRLPQGVERPRVLRYDPTSEPMMRLVLNTIPNGPSLASLGSTAHDALLPQLESLPAIAAVRLRGRSEQELRLYPNAARMAAARVTNDAIQQAITSAISSRTLGNVTDINGTMQVSLSGTAVRPEDIGRIIVAPSITISDIATVELALAKPNEIAAALPSHLNVENADAGGALILEVLPQADASLVSASDAVRERLNSIAESLDATRWRYAGGSLSILTDRAETVRTAINEVKTAAIEGAILAWLVLLVFLRAMRPSIIAFLAIPLSVIGTFLFMSLCGVGLNLMSLGGLALGIGMLVDTAIVVMEAADRCGGTDPDANKRHRGIALGVGEISGAVVAACLTSIAVFVPLAFLPGLLGRLFFDQAFTVSASHVVSLIIGLALVPTLLALPHMNLPSRYGSLRWPPVSGGNFSASWWNPLVMLIRLPWILLTSLRWLFIQGIRILLMFVIGLIWLLRGPTRLLFMPFDRICSTGLQLSERVYDQVLQHVVHRPIIGLGLFIGAFVVGLAFIPQLPVRVMPPSLSSRFTLDIELPRNTDIEKSHQWAMTFLRQLRDWRSDCDAITITGEDSIYTAGLSKRSDHDVHVVITIAKRALDLAGEATFLAELEQRAISAGAVSAAAQTPPLVDLGMGSTHALDLTISGADQETLQQLGLAYSAQLRALECRGVATSATAIADEVLIVPNTARLLAAGLTSEQLGTTIAGAAELREITGFIPRAGADADSGRALPIRLHGALSAATISDLRSLNLGTAASPIPLGSVATIEHSVVGGLILHRSGARVTSITAVAIPSGMTTTAIIKAMTAQHPLPDGYHINSDGMDSITNQGLSAMSGMLLLSIFLVIVVMAIQFESVSQPLIVILSVPMAAAGAFPALLLFGHGLDVMSGIGLVVLVGVAVANAIVLVTTANLRRDQGMPPAEAIATAGRERLRPILMTTATSVFGLLPLAIGWGEAAELRAPLAVAVMGGLCSSTILTLVSLPSVLLLVAQRGGSNPQSVTAEVSEIH